MTGERIHPCRHYPASAAPRQGPCSFARSAVTVTIAGLGLSRALEPWYPESGTEVVMRAERFILETDDEGHIRDSPRLPPGVRMEAFFVILDGSMPDQQLALEEPSDAAKEANTRPEAGRSRELILSIADDFDAPLDDFRDYQ
jgi:hypothetical protein